MSAPLEPAHRDLAPIACPDPTSAAAALGRLAVGQLVKVKGIATASGALLAMEIEPGGREDRVRIAGRVQAIDLAARTVRLLGHDLALDPAVVVTGPDGHAVGLESIAPLARVKVEAIATGHVTVVSALRVRAPRDFVIEKLQGPIATIDADRLSIAGFTVRIVPDTVVGDAR